MQVYSVLNLRHRAADRGRSSNARRMRSTAMSIHRSPIRPARGCATSRASSAKGASPGRRPIFVGGTGLYFRALVDGISRMPEIPDHVRERWRRRLDESGPQELHRVLQRDDPAGSARR